MAGKSVNPVKAQREGSGLGGKVRTLRRRHGLSQAGLAEKLGISASYLNLIESNRRALPAPLLISLARELGVDLATFASDEDARLIGDLTEAFADPLFEADDLTSNDVRELANASPQAARAVLTLYEAYRRARSSADDLSTRITEGEDGAGRSRIPSEEVTDLVQRHGNYFAELEAGAEELWARAALDQDNLQAGLVRCLEHDHGVTVQIARHQTAQGVLRRYDKTRRRLVLSELLPTRSRAFQLAFQLGTLTQSALLDRFMEDPYLTTRDSRALARIALANYFAGAVLMPYEPFLRAAKEERYDVDVLGRRFRLGFEQVCHRLTTLRRPGAEGVPFHMIRIDVAGNISKRFSASGFRIPRYSGGCPRWNVFAAFQTPGMIRIQVSAMPDGTAFFCLARTIQKDSGGYHSQQPPMAIGVGCPLEHARSLVYSEGLDLENAELFVPVGVTCRLCERTDCNERAMPSLKQALDIDENVRGASLYAVTRP
jgi:predicted transcriptional regulator/DNA-binding XRE family transcriptional regulator